MRRVIAPVSAFVLLLVTALPVAAETYLLSYDQTGNGVADTWLVDDDGNFNTAERLFIDANENGRVELQSMYGGGNSLVSFWLDPEEDGYYELLARPVYAANGALIAKELWADFDRNGQFEGGFYDGNLDNYYEWVCVDTNADGVADRWLPNAAPAGRSATDEIARRISTTIWIDRQHALGNFVFFPSVPIPLP